MNHKNNTILNFLQAVQSCFCFLLLGWFSCHIAYAQSTSWDISNLDLSVEENQVRLTLDEIKLANYLIENIDYSCPEVLHIYPKHQCQNALVSADLNGQSYQMKLDTLFSFANNSWEANLTSLNNQISLMASGDSEELTIFLKDMVFSDFFQNSPSLLQQITGSLTGELTANTNALIIQTSNSLTFKNFNYEQSDDVVFFDLSGSVSFFVDIASQKMTAEIAINSGEMLINELYVDYSSFPVNIEINANLNDDFDYVVESTIINLQSMQLQSQVILNQLFEWQLSKIKLDVIDSHHFNQQILGSILGIYGFGNTQMSGGFHFSADLNEGNLKHVLFTFNDYYVLNGKRKIQVDALNGEINWDWLQKSKDSQLNWQSLLLAGMPVNEGVAHFNLSGNQFMLLNEHAFSVFDGSIIIKELTVDELFSEATNMTMNASILPISLKLITEKLNWPVMSGTISGELPGMVKKGSVISFLGALRLSVFEGEMLVKNLSLERLFGVAPVIDTDVTFQNFDLALLTETFGFGQITGKLSGHINDLRITNWKTDRLDAHVYTVKTKGTKQTISQRAIDNISSLGGIKGAISKTFLRFFDDFSYRRIELSCKLHNSVCEIGGMKNQDNQFVIVEGGGIPKINIVGFVRTINWEEFISRLLNANYDN